MTLKELADILNRPGMIEGKGDWRLVVSTSDGGFPAHPSVDVKSISFGFDWDHGKVMIHTEKPVISKPEKKQKNKDG